MKNGDIVEYLERVPNAPRKLFVSHFPFDAPDNCMI